MNKSPNTSRHDELCDGLKSIHPTDWTQPTAYVDRFTHALALLCGKIPPNEIVQAWLQEGAEDVRLQEFAVEHGPVWSQGIVLIEAAQLMAEQPTEGVAHEMKKQEPFEFSLPQRKDQRQKPMAWYVERHAPGRRDHGMKLGPFWKLEEAQELVDENHTLHEMFDRPFRLMAELPIQGVDHKNQGRELAPEDDQ